MISPAGKEEEGMQYALASFFFLPPYAEKDEHGNQSGANNKQQKEPLKRGPHLQIVSVATETRNDGCGSRMDNVRFRENCTFLAGAKGKKWLLDLEISPTGQVKYLFVN